MGVKHTDTCVSPSLVFQSGVLFHYVAVHDGHLGYFQNFANTKILL